MFACMLCWGTWANTFKFAGKWRFELYAYDIALGITLCAVAAAFTLGSANPQDLTFEDNFLIASSRKIVYGLASGVVINLANLFLMSSFSVAGLSVAVPISMATAVITNAIWNYFPSTQANPLLLFGGVICLVVSIILTALALSAHGDLLIPSKPLRPDPRVAPAARPAPTALGVVLAVASGLAMGLCLPLIDNVRSGENGVSPYGLAVLMGGGVLLSTLFLVPFFLTFPVQGAPIEFRSYFSGSKKQHFWGLFGGMIWMGGMIAYLTALSAPTLTAANMATEFGVVYAAALVAALWGWLLWRDFKGSTYKVKMMLLGMFVMYGAGMAMVALAPLFVAQ